MNFIGWLQWHFTRRNRDCFIFRSRKCKAYMQWCFFFVVCRIDNFTIFGKSEFLFARIFAKKYRNFVDNTLFLSLEYRQNTLRGIRNDSIRWNYALLLSLILLHSISVRCIFLAFQKLSSPTQGRGKIYMMDLCILSRRFVFWNQFTRI